MEIKGWIPDGGHFAEVTIGISGGKFTNIGQIGNVSDSMPDRVLLPGFIDVHNHGAVGIDINSADVDGLLKVSAYLASNGVTGWLPTFVPDSQQNYENVIGAIDSAVVRQVDLPVARILGVHYEGVFASEHMCGALHPEYFRDFGDGSSLKSLPLPVSGVRMTTFAPEIEGGVELAARLEAEGWIASIGHTKATVETLDAARLAGARHLTHFFNAMTGLHHRELGVVGWALTRDDITFDIIADGIHVHPDIIRLAARSKGIDNVSLISDSIAPTGLGDGEYQVWGENISVNNGRTSNTRGAIAGSVITLADSLPVAARSGIGPGEFSKMASANPARLLGLEDQIGRIKIGQRADLVVLNRRSEIESVFVGGRKV